ncbi:DUF1648 domain-containing protein [Microbacterium aurum]
MTDRAPLAVRRFTLVAIVLPIIVTALAVAIQVILLPRVPDPMAIHWGSGGGPNGSGPAWLMIVVTLVVGVGAPLLIALSAHAGLRRGDRGATYRLLGAVALATSVLMGVLGAWTFVAQADLASWQDAPLAVVPLVVAFAVAVVAGALGWFVQPDEPYRPTLLAAGAPIELDGDERAVWLQRVQLARGAAIALVAAFVLLLVVTLVSVFADAPAGSVVVLIVVTIVCAAAVVSTLAFHVRVDAAGLTVNSIVGLPRVHVPLRDIASVEAVDVNPMGEFGGWGMRWAPGGGFGVVLRSGPGIRVHRTNGKVVTVTVEDAATGAALLGALAARAKA